MDELDKVKQHLERIAKSDAEAAAWRVESDKWRAVADARHAEAEESRRSLEKQIEETSRTVREVCKDMGGMGQTQGRLVEEFYYQALLKAPYLGDVKFVQVRRNVEATYHDGEHAEYDLLLLNGEVVAVIEVKHRLRRDDVRKMRDVTLPKFRYFLPEHNDKMLAPAVACMTADRGAVALAHECGYAVLLPDGQKVRADTEYLRCIPS